MDDDWASPWADADDRSSTEVIKNLDAHDAEDAARSGGNEPEPRIPNSNVAVHTSDPWGGGEHGFGDVSAWASSSPGIGVGEIPAVRGGPALPAWNEPILVEVPSFIVEKAKDEGGKLANAIGITVPQIGTGKTGEWFGGGIHGTSSNLPIATDEADVWAAGSDWGDTKSERTEDFPVERTDLSPEIAPENIPLPEFDVLVEGVKGDTAILTESSKEYQSVVTTILDREPAKHKNETDSNEEPIDPAKVSIEDIPTISESRSNDDQTPVQESIPKEKAGVGDKIEEKGVNEEESKNEDEEDDDDFGDFADEENFEDAEENFTQDAPASFDELPPLPPTPGLRPDITFDIQTSLVNKLYPIFTTYPKSPPIEELIHTTES